MTPPQIIHVAGVVAVWVIFLSSIRFASAGLHGLKPVATCVWHALNCREADRRSCRRRLIASLDRQYTELLIAITTPWSVALLFLGILLLGIGLSFGSIGDVAQLVARVPRHWEAFDRAMDALGAVGMCAGMASIHAAVTKRRTLSILISILFALPGLGIGIITALHP